MSDLFFQEKGKLILLTLKHQENSYISSIAKEINGTYAHTFNLIKEMEGEGIISTEKHGRTKYVSLTEKGRDLAEILHEFVQVMKKGKRRVKKKPKRHESDSVTPTRRRLNRYQEKIEKLLSEVTVKSLTKTQRAKYKRLSGRYKSLLLRLKPRDKDDKKAKSDLLSQIMEIDTNLYK